MWLAPSDKPTLEETLFHFLLTVCDGRPRAVRPLLAENDTIQALYAQPHPDLVEALRHCLNAFLVRLCPDREKWEELDVPASALGIALAVHNCLAPVVGCVSAEGKEIQSDPVVDFTAQLVATLPPALEQDAALAYHAVLQGSEAALDQLEHGMAEHLHALMELSPLTALWALDMHTPSALECLAAQVLQGWRRTDRSWHKIWPKTGEWTEVAAKLVSDAHIGRWLRHRWLAMPETRRACRNLGLLLELLRQQDRLHRFILEFYEAYDFFCAETKPDEWCGQVRIWPILETIEKLLRAPGDSEAAIQINRRGNEYFMKFRPLLKMTDAERGVIADYRHLKPEFEQAIRALVHYTTEPGDQRIAFDKVIFGDREG
jgi:hypothetical protein